VKGADVTEPSKKGASIGAAVCGKVKVPPNGCKEIVFGLSWDCPIARFASGNLYYKRYTKFYGKEGNVASVILRDALESFREWEKEIEDWQKKVLEDEALPNYYKGALFNELYYLVDGGSIWTTDVHNKSYSSYSTYLDGEDDEIGHFAYLEGLEYLMYNTYDVHFYASFALISLWPKLELSLQRGKSFVTFSFSQHSF
jgi:non-lysosomal glucosylceramidase